MTKVAIFALWDKKVFLVKMQNMELCLCLTDSYVIINSQVGSLLLVFMQQIATGAVWAGVVLQAVTLISLIFSNLKLLYF